MKLITVVRRIDRIDFRLWERYEYLRPRMQRILGDTLGCPFGSYNTGKYILLTRDDDDDDDDYELSGWLELVRQEDRR